MNKIFNKALLLITFISSALVFLLFFFLIYLCFDIFNLNDIKDFFITSQWSVEEGKYGILIPILGSIIISFFALILAFVFSFCLCCLIFLTKNKFISFLFEKTILLMATVPTVIYAFSALFVFVPFISNYIEPSSTLSILVASVVLSFLLIPTMSLIFLNSFRGLEKKHQITFMNLGLNKDDMFFKFILPSSKYYFSQGVLLACTRAFGDTMIALMLAGNALYFPNSIFDSTRTLTSHIALIFENDYGSKAFGAIFVCSLLLLCSNFILILIIRKVKGRTV